MKAKKKTCEWGPKERWTVCLHDSKCGGCNESNSRIQCRHYNIEAKEELKLMKIKTQISKKEILERIEDATVITFRGLPLSSHIKMYCYMNKITTLIQDVHESKEEITGKELSKALKNVKRRLGFNCEK